MTSRPKELPFRDLRANVLKKMANTVLVPLPEVVRSAELTNKLAIRVANHVRFSPEFPYNECREAVMAITEEM